MNHKELKAALKEMYACSPSVETPHGLCVAFEEAGDDVPHEAEVFKACEELVADGVLQNAGRDGYEATVAFMVENGHGDEQ